MAEYNAIASEFRATVGQPKGEETRPPQIPAPWGRPKTTVPTMTPLYQFEAPGPSKKRAILRGSGDMTACMYEVANEEKYSSYTQGSAPRPAGIHGRTIDCGNHLRTVI